MSEICKIGTKYEQFSLITLRKSHLRKSYLVGLSEVGLPASIVLMPFGEVIIFCNRRTNRHKLHHNIYNIIIMVVVIIVSLVAGEAAHEMLWSLRCRASGPASSYPQYSTTQLYCTSKCF